MVHLKVPQYSATNNDVVFISASSFPNHFADYLPFYSLEIFLLACTARNSFPRYLRCGMLHFAMLEGIVGAILAVVSASLARQDQWKRRSRCLLHRHVGQIGAYESIRGGIHFKHCSRRLVIDILVHSEWAHTRAQTQ